MKYSFFLLVAIGLIACMKPQITLADCWQSATAEQNRLQFSVTHQQDIIQGEFTEFTVRFCQTAEKPQKLHVIIATASATTGNSLADAALTSDTFLAAKTWPEAVYHATQFQASDNGFIATGNLTLHGVTHPVSVTFAINKAEDTRILQGHASLQRLDFNIGQDEWQTTQALKNKVELRFELGLMPVAEK